MRAAHGGPPGGDHNGLFFKVFLHGRFSGCRCHLVFGELAELSDGAYLAVRRRSVEVQQGRCLRLPRRLI